MTILSVFLFFLLVVILLLTVILTVPVYYSGEGFWRDQLTGRFRVRAGIIELELILAQTSESVLRFRFAGFSILRKSLHNSKKKQQEGTRIKEKDRISPTDIPAFLERDLIRSLLRLTGEIINAVSPRTFEIKGTLGFEDPYYTGLLAALKSIVPGIQIRPDFNGEVHDITVKLEGRIIFIVILAYVLRFLISREGRYLMKRIRHQKKSQIKATSGASPVYR